MQEHFEMRSFAFIVIFSLITIAVGRFLPFPVNEIKNEDELRGAE